MVCKNVGYEVVNKLTGSYVPFPLCQAGAGGGGAGAAACRKSGRRARSLQLERFFSYRACSCSRGPSAAPCWLSRVSVQSSRLQRKVPVYYADPSNVFVFNKCYPHTHNTHTHTHTNGSLLLVPATGEPTFPLQTRPLSPGSPAKRKVKQLPVYYALCSTHSPPEAPSWCCSPADAVGLERDRFP